MASFFRYIRLVPTAVRLTLAGGATYGTVKVGAWSDSSESREKLDKVQESLQSIKEIEYPPMGHTSPPPLPSSTPHEHLAVSDNEVSSLRSSLTQSWNSAVKGVCHAVVGGGGNSGDENSSSGTFSNGVKKVTDKFNEWTK